MAGGLDVSGARSDLATQGLHFEKIAQTPIGESSDIENVKLDPRTNPDLAQALRIYAKHYLASQDGIPGEGEDIATVVSRLKGEDSENVRAMTVYGLTDPNGEIKGVAFVETYPIDETKKDGSKTEGLVHLLTYAAMEPPYNVFEQNAAFHASIVNDLQDVDKQLGFAGNSVLTTEVNSFRDYNGDKTSDLMDGEFEIKTGLRRAEREVYQLNGRPEIIGAEGRYNKTNIMQIPYTPPALDGEEAMSLAGIKDAKTLAPHLRNNEAFNGVGEPLFLTAETLDGSSLTPHQIELQSAFQKQLVVSVVRDRGIEDKKLILDARSLNTAGFTSMDEAYKLLTEQLKGNTKFPPRGEGWSQSAG